MIKFTFIIIYKHSSLKF